MATRSTLTAVSAIAAEQSYLQQAGSNIANSGTVGYKQGEVQFAELLSEEIGGATSPTAGSGGVNPIAVGSGVRIEGVTTDLGEGTLESTGVQTDVAITGDGYLVVQQGGEQYYTRDGALTVDANDELVTSSGAKVLGWQASATGSIDTTTSVTAITIPQGKTSAAVATTSIDLSGNLPAWSGTSTPPSVTVTAIAYNSLGNTVPVLVTFTAVAPAKTATTTTPTWKLSAVAKTPAKGTVTLLKTITVVFGSNGELKSVKGTALPATGDALTVTTVKTKLAGFTKLALKFPPTTSSTALTQFSGDQTVGVTENGSSAGTLVSYSIGTTGVITGTFSNGQTTPLAQIALASFPNVAGLENVGDNLLTPSADSGQPAIGAAGSGDRGKLLSGELEESNVTLAQQLTDLITAEQAYVADTKVISTSQAMANALDQA